MDRKMSSDLDNYITGHYGEDQFKRPRKKDKKGKESLVHELEHQMKNLNVSQMLELVKRSGNTEKRRFRLKGPTGSLDGTIHDADFGILTIDEVPEFFLAKDFLLANDVVWELIN